MKISLTIRFPKSRGVVAWTGMLMLFCATLHAQPSLTIRESIPQGFIADGNLKEWEEPPTLTLDSQNLVYGSAKENDEFSAEIWIALSKEGMALAGKVLDSKLFFPGYTKEWLDQYDFLNSDHIEVWLAFPRPSEVDNQTLFFEEKPLQDAAWCDNKPDPEKCRSWLENEFCMRPILRRLFIRQYVIMPHRTREVYFSEVVSNEPKSAKAGKWWHKEQFYCNKNAREYFYGCWPLNNAEESLVKTEEGYRWEAFIPAEAFPATSELPINHFRLLVDIVDNDEGYERQERLYSSSQKRRFGNTSTFHSVSMSKPLDFDVHSLMRKIYQGKDRVFFLPAQKSTAFFYLMSSCQLEEIYDSYTFPWQIDDHFTRQDWEPKDSSIYPLPFPEKSLATYHDIALYYVPWPGFIWPRHRMHRLASVKADGTLYFFEGKPMERRCGIDREKEIITVERDGSLHVMLFCHGSLALSGRGECGACPALELQAFSLDKGGIIKHMFSNTAESRYSVQSIVDTEKTCFGVIGNDLLIKIACWDKIQKTYRQLSYTQPR